MAADKQPETRFVKLGTQNVKFPSDSLQELEDSFHLLGNREALLAELDRNGYLLIRGLHKREDVLSARLAVLDYINQSGPDKLDKSHPWQSGILDSRCGHGCIPNMEGREEIIRTQSVRNVLEGSRVKNFFRTLFNEDPISFDYKWLRGVHSESFTGAHVDWVYMGRGTENLFTMWTPFDDVPVEMGTLAMCEGSHRLPRFYRGHFRDTYGNLDLEKVNLKGSGWFTTDSAEIIQRFGGQWKTTDYNAGDAIIFTMKTVHMSTVNMTNKVRISCDTRWQTEGDPIDTRYMGDSFNLEGQYGYHTSNSPKDEKSVTMEEMKRIWGFD